MQDEKANLSPSQCTLCGRRPDLAQQTGEYVFAELKPTGLARRLARRRR